MSRYDPEYYQKNKDKMRESYKTWYENNKERILENMKKARQEAPEEKKAEIREKRKAYYKANKDKALDYAKNYRKMLINYREAFLELSDIICGLEDHKSKSVMADWYRNKTDELNSSEQREEEDVSL